MSRTTPPRPLDITAVFAELAPLARPAIRLHPRSGSPAPQDSSVGGPLLWPADEPWPHCAEGHDTGGPVAMVSVAQLYVRDAPLLRPPGSADLLQVLWCPWDHEPDNKPLTALYWRTAAEVTDVLAEPPEPYAVDYDGYVPQPCLLAPGWKAGGWTSWGLTDPVPRLCPTCGTDMNPLLTIASSEWGSNTRGWIPYEDQSSSESTPGNYRPWNPTLLDLAGGYDLQLHVCPASPDHPHLGLIQ